MTFETIKYETKGSIALLTLKRPDKLNAINGAMVDELNQALDQAEANNKIRAIILCGEGKAFSAGFDLDTGDADPSAPDYWKNELTKDFNIILRFWDCPKPTIAAVHKYCLGSAMEMAVACDITLSSTDCRFGAPEVKFGSGIVALILPWLVGPKKAKELLLLGRDDVTAKEAHEIGLINELVSDEDLLSRAFEVATGLAANDLQAVRLTKQAINQSLDSMGFRTAMQKALEIDIQIESTETPESKAFNEVLEKEGVKAALAWREKQAKED